MKKIILILVAIAFCSCKKCENCKITIKINRKVAGVFSTSTSTTEKNNICGDEISDLKKSAGNVTTKTGSTIITTCTQIECK